ncbi:cancer-related regulator of actin dynamics [Myripristis murdjan]|uniref:cancer-related regulator of actin dynamics n=1 Tax=Myripristis murdjan TaxID=586833 RepID=UPI0011763304|nr:uncharacterized protein KIAA1211-like homolog [Myripristis murdjan]
MESFLADTEEIEDIPGRKKSKLRSLKTRLFGRTKRADGGESTKLSQSASDITAGKGLGSDEDLMCSQRTLGSRALSHDSIFQADLFLSDAEPARVSSQENVHSKIKALQIKLQQQKLHLGPPPLVLPIKRSEDADSRSEDDGRPHSPPESYRADTAAHPAVSKVISQPSSHPLSPILKPAPTRSVPPTPSLSSPLSALSTSTPSAAVDPLDLSSPAQFTPCLDSSAARHRMSVKPRNQRASTKGKRLAATEPRPHTLNNIDHPVSEREEEKRLTAQEETTRLYSHSTQILETGQGRANITSQCLPSTSSEPASITAEPSDSQGVIRSASPSLSPQPTQQDHSLPGRAPSVAAQVLPVQPHRPGDVMFSQPPHLSLIQTDLKETREGSRDFEVQITSHDKRDMLSKAGMTDKKSNRDHSSKEAGVPSSQLSGSLGSAVAFKSSSVRQQAQCQTEATAGINTPAQVQPTSFHISVTTARCRDGERPRSASFVGKVDQAGAILKSGGETEVKLLPSNMNQRGKELQIDRQENKLRDLKPQGGSAAVGAPREEGAPHKSPGFLWDKRDSLKKGEPVLQSKQATMNTGLIEGKEVEDSQDFVEEAVEAMEIQEEEEKTTFGVKLRSTSLSLKFRSDASATRSDSKVKRHSTEMGSLNPPVSHNLSSKSVSPEEQSDKQKREEIGENVDTSKKRTANIPCIPATAGHTRQTDGPPTHSGFSAILVKHNTPAANDRSLAIDNQTVSSIPKDINTAPSGPQEPQTAPQTAPSEVSWMSLAMEKTRSLQQLFTSRLPRDFTGMQTAARPQAQVQPTNQGQAVTQSHLQKVMQSETQTETQIQAQTVKTQQSKPQLQTLIETAKPPMIQSASPAQTAKPSLTTVQQRISSLSTNQLYTSKVSQVSKQPNELSSQPNTTQPLTQSGLNSASHPPIHTNLWTTQSPLRSSPQMEATPPHAQAAATQSLAKSHLSSGQHPTPQQPPWNNRGLHSASQPKAITTAQASFSVSSPSPASAPTPLSAAGGRERTATFQGKEGPSLSERRAVWSGPVGEKAAFLEKRTEWTAPSGTKVELQKTQTETRAPAESPALHNTTPSSKDTKSEGKPGVKLAESSPTKVPGRLADREDKWLRKNLPSSSPTSSSPLQSMSDSGQPSWMELAKRKSMAWSDKTMD